jgi:serine/threonine protein kinase
MKICPACLLRRDKEETRCPKDGSELLALGTGDPRIGTLVAGRFLILEVIGRGGMGTIYRAYQSSMDRDVALKLLSGPDLADEELVARFIREATRPSTLRSPHTIRLYDCGKLDSGELYIAMELLSGTTLERVIEKDAPLQPARARALLDQVCIALAEAHENGLVHRDIKPHNIMIEPLADGREHVKVLDFGLVKLIGEVRDDHGTLTRPGSLYGTPPYMAPELWNPEFGAIGPATDIYALGVLIHEMSTGKRPFNAGSVSAFMYAHLQEAPLPMSAHVEANAEIKRLQPIVSRCLEKNPADRYNSVEALRRDLAALSAFDKTLPPARPRPDSKKRPAAPSRLGDARSALAIYVASGSMIAALSMFSIDRMLDRGTGQEISSGDLVVTSMPSGAMVVLEGRPTGLTTPARIRGLLSGRDFSVILEREGHTPAARSVRVEPRQEVKLDVQLSPRRE